MEDAALGAFSVFFTQSPGLAAFQRTMQENKGLSNGQSLFQMEKIPSDNWIEPCWMKFRHRHYILSFQTFLMV